MIESRVIPVLGLMRNGLYKTVSFDAPSYVGDPLNAVHIFNEKRVNEMFVMGFRNTVNSEAVPFRLLKELASEAFFPLGYGGGLKSLGDCSKVISLGFEKVCFNTAAFTDPDLIGDVARELGCSSVVVSLDVRLDRKTNRYMVYTHSGTRSTGIWIEDAAVHAVNCGAGELLIHHIDRDGTYEGYDFNATGCIQELVQVPLIILGGAAGLNDIEKAKEHGIQGIAASSLFVYYGRLRAVLINYPEKVTAI